MTMYEWHGGRMTTPTLQEAARQVIYGWDHDTVDFLGGEIEALRAALAEPEPPRPPRDEAQEVWHCLACQWRFPLVRSGQLCPQCGSHNIRAIGASLAGAASRDEPRPPGMDDAGFLMYVGSQRAGEIIAALESVGADKMGRGNTVISMIGALVGMSKDTLMRRLRAGWDVRKALTTPVDQRFRNRVARSTALPREPKT
jgi:hypothetical protein